MSMILHGHPFSSYTWKALIALYEKELPFTFQSVEDDFAANQEDASAAERAHLVLDESPEEGLVVVAVCELVDDEH